MGLTLLIASAVILVGYIVTMVSIYGEPKSISDTYYSLPKCWKFIFTLAIWGFAIPIAIVGSTPLIFFAVAFICFVGAAAAFKDSELIKKVHMVGAVGGIFLGMASIWIDFHLPIIVVIAVAQAVFVKIFTKNPIFWVEIIAIVAIWLTIFGSITA